MRTIKTLGIEETSQVPEWIRVVQQAVSSLQFGDVHIVVHNSKVVQIQKTEKLRLEQNH